jgi:NADH-quinone oxidoreductase subunit N
VRIVKIMYFDEPVESFDRPMGLEVAGVAAVSAVLTLAFFVLPSPLLAGAAAAASSLFGG